MAIQKKYTGRTYDIPSLIQLDPNRQETLKIFGRGGHGKNGMQNPIVEEKINSGREHKIRNATGLGEIKVNKKALENASEASKRYGL